MTEYGRLAYAVIYTAFDDLKRGYFVLRVVEGQKRQHTQAQETYHRKVRNIVDSSELFFRSDWYEFLARSTGWQVGGAGMIRKAREIADKLYDEYLDRGGYRDKNFYRNNKLKI